MARRSNRIASSQGSQASSPPQASQTSPAVTNKKRKAESGDSPSAKRGKKDEKQQKTIEESMDVDKETSPAPDVPKETESLDVSKDTSKQEPDSVEKPTSDPTPENSSKAEQVNGHTKGPAEPEKELDQEAGADSKDPDAAEKEDKPTDTSSKSDQVTGETANGDTSKEEQKSADPAPAANGDNAVEPDAREGKVPSSILEKGIMYFLTRGRVNTENPKNVQDLQRSFMLLRPLPHGAKIGDGSIGDEKNCRLIAIPKKMVPLSGNDKWTAFVETANTSFGELKETFMNSNKYDTQTGQSTTPAATPVAEGVYAITTTGRETHLAYILTLPEKLGDIQTDLGLRQQGSFIVSAKNPKAPGPASADLGRDPGFSEEILNTFRGLRWAPLQPEMLNYEACQFLLIGEGKDGLDKATEPQDGDKNKEETAKEELEKLEGEDEIRIEHLNGEDAVFADLGTNAKDYPSLQTTW